MCGRDQTVAYDIFINMITPATDRIFLLSDYEFFQSEEATFTCKHDKTLSELSEVKWKIGRHDCAWMYIKHGTITSRTFNCAFEPRVTNFTSTKLTLSEMKSFDDGEFSCTITLADYETTIEVTRFNVTVKGRVPFLFMLTIIKAISVLNR